MKQVEINPTLDLARFARPLDLNRDTITDKPASVSGRFVCAVHRGAEDEIFETVEELKDFIAGHEMEIAGPLVVSRDAAAAPTVCIAIGPAGREPDVAEAATYSIRTIEPARALCLTHVGEDAHGELATRLRDRATELGLEPTGPTLEVWFSQDGRLRQMQLPVR
ncbi:MAG: hypothetical protein R3F20_11380 [Planctomycetota bacterium]